MAASHDNEIQNHARTNPSEPKCFVHGDLKGAVQSSTEVKAIFQTPQALLKPETDGDMEDEKERGLYDGDEHQERRLSNGHMGDEHQRSHGRQDFSLNLETQAGPDATESPRTLSRLEEDPAETNLGETKRRNQDLFFAANKTVKLCSDLLDKNADPNWLTPTGKTALMRSSYEGNVEVVRLLLDRMANPNICNVDNKTAIYHATMGNHASSIRALLAGRADPNIANKSNWTPLYYAADEGLFESVEALLGPCFFPCDIDVQRKSGWSPLYTAINERQVAIARLLVERGADLTARDEYDPLQEARRKGLHGITELIRQKRGDVKSQVFVEQKQVERKRDY